MEPKDFASIVDALLEFLSKAAPHVYAAAAQSVVVGIVRDGIVYGLLTLAFGIASFVCFWRWETREKQLLQPDGSYHYTEVRVLKYDETGILLGATAAAGALLSLMLVVSALTRLWQLDYLTLKAVIELVPR